jgi:hypothetical protein
MVLKREGEMKSNADVAEQVRFRETMRSFDIHEIDGLSFLDRFSHALQFDCAGPGTTRQAFAKSIRIKATMGLALGEIAHHLRWRSSYGFAPPSGDQFV